MNTRIHSIGLGLLLVLSGSRGAFAASTTFTYQGQLKDGGALANGAYDLEFRVFDALSGGGQQGGTVTVDDLAITNGLFTAVLDFGGFLGVGDKYFAVPWEALQLTDDQRAVVLDVTKRDLKQAPGFDKNNWPDFSGETAFVIYEFYGVPLPDSLEKQPAR